ncbi:MAG: hypothetical protein PVI59_00295 [Anaerolineae bacterium]
MALWRNDPTEEEGLNGFLAFTEPHFHLPILVGWLSLLLGLFFNFTLWEEVLPGFRILIVLVTPMGCLLSVAYFHERRKHLRERELLREVKRGWKKGLGLRAISLFLPATAAAIVVIFLYSLISFEGLWKIVSTFTMKGAPELGEGIRQRVITVLPFISLIGYLFLTLSFAASSTLLLVRHYINRLKNFLPPPIFLQHELLTRVVRREAEIELGRQNPERLNPEGLNRSTMAYLEDQTHRHLLSLPASLDMPLVEEDSMAPQLEFWIQAATWTWDELERTEDGGIEMKVARDEIYHLPKRTDRSNHIPHSRVAYVVRADPWGRITSIKREEKDKDKRR